MVVSPQPSELFLKTLGAKDVADVNKAILDRRASGDAMQFYAGGVKKSPTCCGTLELTTLNFSTIECLVNLICQYKIAPKTAVQYNCFCYYSVDPEITKKLESLGFVEVANFLNPNSDNLVHVLFLTF